MSCTHDADLLRRMSASLRGDDDDGEVLAFEYLVDKCGVSQQDALTIVYRYMIQSIVATPEALRLTANEIDIELPLLPFFES